MYAMCRFPTIDKREKLDTKRDHFCEQHTVGMAALVESKDRDHVLHGESVACLRELCDLHHDSDAPFATKRIDKSAADFADAELLKLKGVPGLSDLDREKLIGIYTGIKQRAERTKRPESNQ